MKKNDKRANLQKITAINSNQHGALLWTKYEQSYSKVYKTVDWGKSGEFYARKSCNGLFCKDTYMNSQLVKSEESKVEDSASSYKHNVNYNNDKYDQHNQPHRRTQQKFTYQSFQEESKCVVCATVKKDAHGNLVSAQTMTFRETDDSLHLTEKQLKEFAQIHVENCTRFQDAGQRILLNSSTIATLFAANVVYHKYCYQPFRALSGKKNSISRNILF